MLPKDFEALILSGDIDRVAILRPSAESAWPICGYGDAFPTEAANMRSLDQKGSPRLWSDLDAAYGFIRKSGFRQAIEIDG